MDEPQEQLRAISLPADPVPVWQPRPENFLADEFGPEPPIGIPTGLDWNAVMPRNGAIQKDYGIPLDVISVIANGTNTVYVSCRKPHNLLNDDQIAVEGLSNINACGFFSVVMFTPMAFTYTTGNPVAAGSLLTETARIITCLVGLPRGYTQIPQLRTVPDPVPPPVPNNYLLTDDRDIILTDAGNPIEVSTPVYLLTDDGLIITTGSDISIDISTQVPIPAVPVYITTDMGQTLTTDSGQPIEVQ